MYLSLPLVIGRLYWRSIKNPEYRKRWRERLGFLGISRLNDSIWIHAVSVGETQAAEPLIRKLVETASDTPIVITTTTPTGAERVAKLFGENVFHSYFPYDLPFTLKRFLRHVQPKVLLVMETEVWPNLVSQCEIAGVPVILVNARMSEQSAKGYARLGRFTKQVFGQLTIVAAQSPADAERFLGLGAKSDRVRVTGSIKFDIKLPGSIRDLSESLRRQWSERRVWIAASTHEGEDEVVLAAHAELMKAFPDAMLILVPRHPERFDAVYKSIKKLGMSVCRRSDTSSQYSGESVYLGDTMGELPVLLAASDAAFVGGSLVPVGGHNILEPAALGVPVCFGPHMFNFSTISSLFLASDAAVQINSRAELVQLLLDWLGDASKRTEVGEAGKKICEENTGALDRLLGIVEPYLGKSK